MSLLRGNHLCLLPFGSRPHKLYLSHRQLLQNFNQVDWHRLFAKNHLCLRKGRPLLDLPLLLPKERLLSSKPLPKKSKRIKWIEIKLINLLSQVNFDFNNISSLWYCNLDYRSYLRQQLLTPLTKRGVKNIYTSMAHCTQ